MKYDALTMIAKAPPSPDPAACESGATFHPLEFIPWFRRYRPGLARDLLYTFIWNCGLGIAFWIVAVAVNPRTMNLEYLGWNLLVSNAIGYNIHGLFALCETWRLDRRARAAGPVMTALYYTAVSTTGVVAGFLMVVAWQDEARFYNFFTNPKWLATMAFSSMVISIILSAVFFLRARTAAHEAEIERQRVHAARVEREATLANLRALQAQIEPHFLFNTLANVVSLVDSDPKRAKGMLEDFIRFLRSALGATRMESTTLAAEAELIAAYLDVLKVRMEGRLDYAIDVDAGLHAFTLPPMLLQPVVENAIRHGLEPKVEGGKVRVSARRDGDQVAIEIADSGVGFANTTRGGVGLANLRDRLKLLYGARASLVVADNAQGGATVTLRLPDEG